MVLIADQTEDQIVVRRVDRTGAPIADRAGKADKVVGQKVVGQKVVGQADLLVLVGKVVLVGGVGRGRGPGRAELDLAGLEIQAWDHPIADLCRRCRGSRRSRGRRIGLRRRRGVSSRRVSGGIRVRLMRAGQ